MTYELKPEKMEDIGQLSELCVKNGSIDPELYAKYEVKRGLRDINGRGVLTGLTEIAEVRSYIIQDVDMIPCEGKLFYRGIDIEDLVGGFIREDRFGYEEVTYLLLFGELPDKKQLEEFRNLLSDCCTLPTSFVRDVIMKAPSPDMMNTLARSVLTLFSYDPAPNDTSIPNVLRQCLQLIAQFPMLSVYGYQAFRHYKEGESLVIHSPERDKSVAENILMTLRPDKHYSQLEARILDVALVLHMEHGAATTPPLPRMSYLPPARIHIPP
jgi:citrate synthase